MPRAALVLRERFTDEESNIFDLAIWRVEITPAFPEGVRYRLAFVRQGASAPVVLYDNHAPKGHHRHVEGIEEAYNFVGVAQLIEDFLADVSRITDRDNA